MKGSRLPEEMATSRSGSENIDEPRASCSAKEKKKQQVNIFLKNPMMKLCQRSSRSSTKNNKRNKVLFNYNPKYEVNIHVSILI